MQRTSKQLPNTVSELKQLLLQELELSARKDAQIEHLSQQYQHLLEQFRIARQSRFGQSSETSLDQLGLFNEVEQTLEEAPDEAPDEAEQEPSSYTRNKPKRKPLPDSLPRETVVHDMADADKICECCGHELHRMGEDKSERLEFIPASIKVIEHVRLKYSCRQCEQQGIAVNIKIAPVPAAPIAKSFATASLLSQIITSKYQYSLPLYRQEQLFKQYGIELSRKTMADWMVRSSELLMPITQRLKAIQLQQTTIHADETSLKVVHEDKNRCYMWVYCTGSDSPSEHDDDHPPNIVLYDYRNTRAGHCASDYLGGLSAG